MICNNCDREIEYKAVCPYCGNRMLKDHLPHHMPDDTVIGGRYRIKGVLGEGGFGITYLGYNEKLDMPVAIKEYYPNGVSYRSTHDRKTVYFGSDNAKEFFEHGKERFLREAKTLVMFNNEPGIVKVHDFVEENNTAYLIMEYLDGETLQQYLRRHGNMSVDEAFAMLEPVMRTLEKIHAAGIIHRDISPDNIMYLRNGSVKLMDFGCAKDFDGDNRSMSVMLKQGYAPEEQYRRNGEQGPWTDVYGLCATIYRCIVGKAPEDALDRLVDDGLKKPSELGIDISPKLEEALMYGLAVRRQDRCQNMTELLGCMQSGKPKSAPPEPDDLRTVAADPPASADDKNKTVYADTGFTAPAPDFNKADTIPDFDTAEKADSDKSKKSKKGLLIAIISLVLVAAITVTGVVIWKNKSPSTAPEQETVEETESSIDAENSNSAAKSDSTEFQYSILDNGTVKITGYTGSASNLEIPSKLDGKTVTVIGEKAFSLCSSIITVTIPDSVTSIRESAFFNCGNLASVTIPDSVTYINESAFRDCKSLTSVTIPNSVVSIGYYAFSGCKSMTSVTISNSLATIGEYVFRGCSNLSSVIIPDSVTSIGDSAFSGCKSMTSVTIPDSVNIIDPWAFYGCDNLTIYGKSGSTAERFANKNNIPFSAIE